MKLPNFLTDPRFNSLRQDMRAEALGDFSVDRVKSGLTDEELAQLAAAGIDVPGELIAFRDDGTLTYRGVRVLVYIRDIANYRGLESEDSMPRFHVAGCRTLFDMKEKRRFERYVVATRDDGTFLVNEIRPDSRVVSLQTQLRVCQNCLSRLSFNGFSYDQPKSSRLRRVEEFDLKDFFRQYPKDLHVRRPADTEDTQPLNDYPSNWDEIAQRVKRRAMLTCGECGLQPAAEFLDVHHIDGRKFNCANDNLLCLCLACHAKIHPHIRGTPRWSRFESLYGRR